jgi:hypothetical protein
MGSEHPPSIARDRHGNLVRVNDTVHDPDIARWQGTVLAIHANNWVSVLVYGKRYRTNANWLVRDA